MSTSWHHQGEQEKEPLQYTACGLDDVYLLSGYTIEETPYGQGISIKHLDELHDAIGGHLVNTKKELSGKELRFLRKHMDLTQSELGRLLGLSSQQVARCEKGESQISGPADHLLRILFTQHITNTVDPLKLVETLDSLDDVATKKQVFAPTDHGWRAAA